MYSYTKSLTCTLWQGLTEPKASAWSSSYIMKLFFSCSSKLPGLWYEESPKPSCREEVPPISKHQMLFNVLYTCWCSGHYELISWPLIHFVFNSLNLGKPTLMFIFDLLILTKLWEIFSTTHLFPCPWCDIPVSTRIISQQICLIFVWFLHILLQARKTVNLSSVTISNSDIVSITVPLIWNIISNISYK